MDGYAVIRSLFLAGSVKLSHAMTVESGSHLGPYEILSAIGAGGMGQVYRARDKRLDRTIAVKVLAPNLSGNAEHRQSFEREARTVAALRHAHICPVYDI